MNATVEFVSGRCTNELFCAVASAGDTVRVPAGSRFVCNFCGGKLVHGVAKRPFIGLRAGAVIGGSLGATGLALFCAGLFLVGPANTGNPAPQLTVVAAK